MTSKQAEWRKDNFMRLTVEDVPGIYAIVNRTNDKKYVGQSLHLQTRRENHWCDLIKGVHMNRYLQADFDKCGKDAFSFVVLEYIPYNKIKKLDEREQYWINAVNAKYNIQKDIAYAKAHFAPFEVVIIRYGETYQRPEWHEWVYGGSKNPLLKVRPTGSKMP